MSKYSDKKLAKRMGTYVPPYDRNNDTVHAAIRSAIKVNDIDSQTDEIDDTVSREFNSFLKSKNQNKRKVKRS